MCVVLQGLNSVPETSFHKKADTDTTAITMTRSRPAYVRQSGNTKVQNHKSRHAARGILRYPAHAGPLGHLANTRPTSPGTIAKHCHAYRAVPRHWPGNRPPAWSCRPQGERPCCRNSSLAQSRSSRQRETELSFRCGTHIPIRPQRASDKASSLFAQLLDKLLAILPGTRSTGRFLLPRNLLGFSPITCNHCS